ncbi:hypothetical protein B296_00020211 [Ensete ventricosum]|uniref:Uncharacterized protein n=1 Tax=Ensete ventricosum TaxID=4639 RepID=A0A426ZK70_ENSVE|nr:hypothetical protein B296_00020211 [Ensete ventricosum]
MTQSELETNWHQIGNAPTKLSRSSEKGLAPSRRWMANSCQGSDTYPISKSSTHSTTL